MEFTAELILAVIAAATGTLAIFGVIGFFVFVCHQHRLRHQRNQEADRKRNGGGDSLPDITSPNDTSSAMTNDDNSNELETDIEAVLDLEDDSVITKTYPARIFPRVRSAQDTESCYGDDNWSYAVTEEGSVLVSQELSFEKQSLHAPSASGKTSSDIAVRTTPVPVYFQDQNGSVMYEV